MPEARREDYWKNVEKEMNDQTDDADRETVRERIIEELDADKIHGLTVTRRQGETVYCVVSRSTTVDKVSDLEMDFPVLDLRTVVVDFEDDAVTVMDNGVWTQQDPAVAETLTEILGRTTTDLNTHGDDALAPTLKSAVDGVDPDLFLGREIEPEDAVAGQHTDKMENHVGIDPARPWGYGGGPPPEVEHVVARLEEAGLDPSEHLSRLVWGKKEPMDRVTRPVDELTGNYGIELQPRDSGLIAIDVDYPEEFPDTEFPETLEVSSPHGDDSQRHIILRCDEKEKVAEEVGAWAVQAVPWGDLWIGDRYVVGPGSQLSEFGCDDGEHTRGERGGCASCEDPEGGFYDVVSDAPIATVDAEFIIDLLDDFLNDEESEAVLRNGRADPDPPGADDGGPVCDNCGHEYDEDEAADALKTLTLGDDERRVCRGGCN